jgi:hypothetical protein
VIGRLVVLGLALALAACASRAIIVERPEPPSLRDADALLGREAYEAAVGAYDAFLREHAEHPAAPRARATRVMLLALLDTRAQLERLQQEMSVREGELVRAREELVRRDGELGRARQEASRLAAEAERLRKDIERLKEVDIRLERRR